MSTTRLRNIVSTRRTITIELYDAFMPAERAADQAAIEGHRFMALALAKRDDAALPKTVGEQALREVGAACAHVFEAQAAFRRAHALWPTIADEGGDMFAPECPEPGQPNGVLLTAVA